VRKLWEAFKNKDKTTLSSLLDDKFRMFEEGLSTFGDKKAEVNGPDEYDLLNYTLSDFTVKPIGHDSALVTYVAQYEGKSGGEIQKAKSVFGEVWTHNGDHWKAVYLQETYIK
ncbi:MAG: nuclear transport factor 2 family protein, partial [Candidatus Sulfotelmatobacter sp.]